MCDTEIAGVVWWCGAMSRFEDAAWGYFGKQPTRQKDTEAKVLLVKNRLLEQGGWMRGVERDV